jgi:hypothetical protein
MWKTLALLAVAALPAAAQGGSLTISNQRLTYGYFGPTRTDTKFLPGDMVFLAFELNNMAYDADGKAEFSVTMEVSDPSGKSLYKQPPRTARAQNYLGGKSLASQANIGIPADFKPGNFTIVVTVQDKGSSTTKSIKQQVEVLPTGFGVVGIGTSADPDGHYPVAPVGTLGSTVYINFAVVGFAREATAAKLPHVTVKMRILDEKGKDTLPKALPGKAREGVPPELKIIPMNFGVTLNRVGHFTVELTATCELCGKSTKTTFPIKVTTLE